MLLGDANPDDTIPIAVQKIITSLSCFIVENERTARRYLRLLDKNFDIDGSTFYLLNKHTNPNDLELFLSSIEKENIGILSESGCPAIADPGAKVVALAHKKNISVVPLVGPSSILLAIMASGMNGQSFAFNGYLPIQQNERQKAIKHFEALTIKHGQTQAFIETPYRNKTLFDDLLKNCNGSTLLSIATDVSLPSESIVTKSIQQWKKTTPDFHKKPTVFVIGK